MISRGLKTSGSKVTALGGAWRGWTVKNHTRSADLIFKSPVWDSGTIKPRRKAVQLYPTPFTKTPF